MKIIKKSLLILAIVLNCFIPYKKNNLLKSQTLNQCNYYLNNFNFNIEFNKYNFKIKLLDTKNLILDTLTSNFLTIDNLDTNNFQKIIFKDKNNLISLVDKIIINDSVFVFSFGDYQSRSVLLVLKINYLHKIELLNYKNNEFIPGFLSSEMYLTYFDEKLQIFISHSKYYIYEYNNSDKGMNFYIYKIANSQIHKIKEIKSKDKYFEDFYFNDYDSSKYVAFYNFFIQKYKVLK